MIANDLSNFLVILGNTRSPYKGLSPTNQRPFGLSLQLQKTEKVAYELSLIIYNDL